MPLLGKRPGPVFAPQLVLAMFWMLLASLCHSGAHRRFSSEGARRLLISARSQLRLLGTEGRFPTRSRKKILRLTSRRSRSTSFSYPFSIAPHTLCITLRRCCNNRCHFCAIGSPLRSAACFWILACSTRCLYPSATASSLKWQILASCEACPHARSLVKVVMSFLLGSASDLLSCSAQLSSDLTRPSSSTWPLCSSKSSTTSRSSSSSFSGSSSSN